MTRHVRSAIVVTGLGLLGFACLGEDVPSGTTTSGADAGAVPGSLVQLGGFELEACGGWTKNGATAVSDATARSGSRSCRICREVSPGVFGIFQVLDGVPAGNYVAEAWVRATPEAGLGSTYLGLQGVDTDGAFVGDAQETSTSFVDTWKKVTTSIAYPGGKGLAVSLTVRDGDACMLVDDVAVTKAP